VSLVLCVACFTLQNWPHDVQLIRREGPGPTVLELYNGNLSVSWEPRLPYRPPWAGQVNRFGFRYNVTSDGRWYMWAPLWAPGALLAASAVVCAALAGWFRRPRKPGVCPSCGYDLRATPERCPECGTKATTWARSDTLGRWIGVAVHQWLGVDPLAVFALRRIEARGWQVSVHFVNNTVEFHAMRADPPEAHVTHCEDGIAAKH
jgi:hypothetical protein